MMLLFPRFACFIIKLGIDQMDTSAVLRGDLIDRFEFFFYERNYRLVIDAFNFLFIISDFPQYLNIIIPKMGHFLHKIVDRAVQAFIHVYEYISARMHTAFLYQTEISPGNDPVRQFFLCQIVIIAYFLDSLPDHSGAPFTVVTVTSYQIRNYATND